MQGSLLSAVQERLDREVAVLHAGKEGTCSVNGCPNDALAKGFCNTHYLRSRNGRNMEAPVKKHSKGVCIECGKAIGGKGGWNRCSRHFKAARQKAIKEAIVEALGGCCQSCGGIFPLPVYDFHHTGAKDSNPSHLISNGSLEAISHELSTCILLCANCHRIEHAK